MANNNLISQDKLDTLITLIENNDDDLIRVTVADQGYGIGNNKSKYVYEAVKRIKK